MTIEAIPMIILNPPNISVNTIGNKSRILHSLPAGVELIDVALSQLNLKKKLTLLF